MKHTNPLIFYLISHFPSYITNWLLRKLEVHYRPYISSPLVSIFSKSYPISRITTSLKSILILSPHLRLGLLKGLFPSGFPTKTLYAFLDCSIRVTCPAHLSRLDLRFLIMLGEEYNACSSELCNSLHSLIIPSLLAQISSSVLYSRTPLTCALSR